MREEERRIDKFNSICRQYHLQLAFLFGSQAKTGYDLLLEKEPHEPSDLKGDIDLGVVFLNPPVEGKKLHLYGSLYEDLFPLFQPIKLDLIFLKEADYLVQYEACCGINIFKTDDLASTDYVEHVVKYAADWKFEMDLFYRDVREAIGNGQIFVEYRTIDQ